VTERGVIPVAESAGLVLAQLGEQAQSYARMARAPRTVAAYASDWRLFSAWCAERDLQCLPATVTTIALYVADQASRGLKPASIDRRLVAINREHKVAGFAPPGLDPVMREVLAGVRRTHGSAQRQVTAVLTDDLKSMLQSTPETLRGLRNRAILLLGFAGAFRRTELVALNVGDLDFRRNGLVVMLRKSKPTKRLEAAVSASPSARPSRPARCAPCIG
jgi:site-specific recombinase XerD